uniref:rhomboid protease n=1 Tax=Lates calcarifer TaxID=8187 RepID=A0A4W6FDP1_LATCA
MYIFLFCICIFLSGSFTLNCHLRFEVPSYQAQRKEKSVWDHDVSCNKFYLALSVCVHLQYDPENSGFISTERFRDLLATHGSELDPHKLEVLLALADGNADGKICYQDFVNLMSNKRSNSFRRAILQGSRQLKGCSLRDEVGLGLSQRLVRHVAYETLPREVDRKWYFDSYTYCPPPLLILAITIAEVAVFMYYGFQLDRLVLQVSSPSFLKSPLPYHPQLRAQAWRYLSYCFMHTGIEHLSLNMAMQLLVGVPLEMVHGALRIGLVYVCGVLAGEVSGVSVTDMTAPVVGSSGGVYALVSGAQWIPVCGPIPITFLGSGWRSSSSFCQLKSYYLTQQDQIGGQSVSGDFKIDVN